MAAAAQANAAVSSTVNKILYFSLYTVINLLG